MHLPLNIAWPLRALARIARSRLLRLGAFPRHEAGTVAVLAAILFPIMIGGMGLGAETGYWYLTQRKLQHAADVSAYAGAVRRRAGDNTAQVTAAADHIAAASGVAKIVVNNPPTSGVRAGDIDSVEVLISETQPLLFSSLFMAGPVTIKARAVAQFLLDNKSVACVLALSTTAAGAATVSGSTVVNLQGCDIHSNSNAANSVLMSGSGTLTADCASAVGGVVATAHMTLANPNCPKAYVGAIADPYKTVAQPANTGPCAPNNVGHPTQITPPLTPTYMDPSRPGVASMRFCGGLTVKGEVTFQPGLYIIDGGTLTVNAGQNTWLRGDGVTFFLTNNASLGFNGAARLNLEAPKVGPFKGILFFGARSNNVTHLVNGASNSTLQGAIYAAGAAIQYKGNSATTNGCTQLIGNTVTFIGNSTMNSTCANAGTTEIATNQAVALVE